jgi:hypothetical protein
MDQATPTFQELIPGIQLAIFEVLWGVESQLDRISFDEDRGSLRFYFEWKAEPSAEARKNVEYLMREVIDVAFEGSAPNVNFFAGVMSAPEHYRELMSRIIFEAIASRHAPWRLEDGRSDP